MFAMLAVGASLGSTRPNHANAKTADGGSIRPKS